MANKRARYAVGGMACSFCAKSIRKALDRTTGVEDVEVSLAHEEVLVRYDDKEIEEVAVRDTLRELGYTIRDPDKRKRFEQQQDELDVARRRLAVAGAASLLTGALMLWMIFVRGTYESGSLAMDLATLALAVGTMFVPGRYIKEKAYHSLRRGILNQHVLLEAGAFAGLLGGLLGLPSVPGLDLAAVSGGHLALPIFEEFPTVHFFAVSVFITTYHVLSEYTALVVRTRALRAVQDLLDLRPDTARRVRDADDPGNGSAGDVEEVPVEELAVGDRVRVKPGEPIPVDGEVLEGSSAVDESLATGESLPEEKGPGDEVIGGSVTRTGSLHVEVTTTGEDAFLTRIAREIEAARAAKPTIVRLADRVLQYFVPAVLALAALSLSFWVVAPLAWGGDPDVQRGAFAALAVLVLGYPCALGMATPLALVRGGGKAAARGVLMRSGDAFQVLPGVDYAVFDKTGTVTVGEPAVVEVVGFAVPDRPEPESVEREVLATAASTELFSEHPLGEAIVRAADEQGLDYDDPDAFEAVTGKGVRATAEGVEVLVGKPGWLVREGVDLAAARDDVERFQARGLTASGVARDGELVGLIGLGDEARADAAETVRRLRAAGITTVLLTGDDRRTAKAVAREVGIDRVMADVLPGEKRDEIDRLQGEGRRVAMVGDGINDAPALTQADVGIAVAGGTDVAVESADVVLLGNRLGGVMDAYEIARGNYRKTKQNLLVAFSFNGIGVSAATTGLVHPVFAMIAMVLSVSAVLANSFAGQLLPDEGGGTRSTGYTWIQ